MNKIIRKQDISKVSYKPWSHEHDIDISLIEKIELGKLKTKLIFKKGKKLLLKTAALKILATDEKNILNA